MLFLLPQDCVTTTNLLVHHIDSLAITFQFLWYGCKLVEDLLQRWPPDWLAIVQIVSDLKSNH